MVRNLKLDITCKFHTLRAGSTLRAKPKEPILFYLGRFIRENMSPEEEIIEKFKKVGPIGNRAVLEKIPEKERRYKCHTCLTIVDSTPCPVCGEKFLEIMCPLDHCNCHEEVIGGNAYCLLCGEAVCPTCNCHNVVQINRVTGYLSDVSGWNQGKRQELKDRVRTKIGV